MMTCEPFKAAHAREIEVQPAQQLELGDGIRAEAYEASGNGYTLRVDGRILICGGVVPTEFGSEVWALVAARAPLLVVHRAARRFLSLFPFTLVATAPAGFAAGCRWLEMLGFKYVRRVDLGAEHLLYMRGVRCRS